MWDQIAPMVVLSTMSLSAAAVFVLRGPLGKALADRLAGRSATGGRDVEQLRHDVDDLRAELGAMQERLDFAERLLTRGQERA
jgi:outer membrane murein-binding lipoprotein Lpp